jgi:beta-lactamase class A
MIAGISSREIRLRLRLPDRRSVLIGTGAGLLSACQPKAAPLAQGPARLDTGRLTSVFTVFAQRARPAVFGFGVALLDHDLAWVSSAEARFPLQSVFKAFLAGAALAQVDAGRLRLDSRIIVKREDIVPWNSPVAEAWRGRDMSLPMVDLLALAVQQSDNVAADVLMRQIGGPAAVTAWLRGLGVGGVNVDRYETELQPATHGLGPFQPAWADPKAWMAARDAVPAADREAAMASYLADPRDTATLPSSLDFLVRLGRGKLLTPASTRLLLRLMTDCETGAHRLKAGLPADAILAHKTGTSATDLGITPATNDIGIVTLANGRQFALAAYLAGSTATEAVREAMIAEAARLAAGCVS